MAINTAGTYLNYSADGGTTYNLLTAIVNYPDMGASPSKLDTTDLSALKYRTSILGLQELPDLVFEANYDEDVYNTIQGLTDTYDLQLQFGTDGADGQFDWTGMISCYVNGAGVDEVRRMTITLSAETELVFTTTA